MVQGPGSGVQGFVRILRFVPGKGRVSGLASRGSGVDQQRGAHLVRSKSTRPSPEPPLQYHVSTTLHHQDKRPL
eukprot:3904403-Rhodomonas_salina.1